MALTRVCCSFDFSGIIRAFDETSDNMPKNKPEENSNQLILSKLADEERGKGCSEKVYATIADTNQYGRLQSNSKKVGHVLVTTTPSGALLGTQYDISQSRASQTSIVNPLTDLKQMVRGHTTWIRAKNQRNEKFISKRKVQVQVGEGQKPSDLFYLSPYEYDSADDGSEYSDIDAPVEIFRDDLISAEREAKNIVPPMFKRGRITLSVEDLRKRDENPKRSCQQKKVIGQDAKGIYEQALALLKDCLSPKIIRILQLASDERRRYFPENEFSGELLHLIAHSLSFISTKPEDDPQRIENLGAGSKWANTEMMLLERLAKWFQLSEVDATVTVDNFFEMLLSTDVIKHIHQELTIVLKGQFVRLIHDIDVFKEYPAFRKSTDLAQTIAILDNIFNQKTPISTEVIQVRHLDANKKVDLKRQETAQLPALEATMMLDETEAMRQAFLLLSGHPQYQVCQKIRDTLPKIKPDETHYIIAIVDLETTGLNDEEDEIIELAAQWLAVCKHTNRIVGVVYEYEGLNQPRVPISEAITRITGITQDALAGQSIQWTGPVHEMFSSSRYIVCHNAPFDSGFLKKQTPPVIRECMLNKRFACTLNDIDWNKRGFDPRKLDFLSFLLGYFYDAHRAKNDVLATRNLLLNVPGAFDELLYNAQKRNLFFFSQGTLGTQVLAPMPKAHQYVTDESAWSSLAVDRAVQLLETSSVYQIYRAVPIPPLVAKDPAQKTMTIVSLKTDGADYEVHQIIGLAILSFTVQQGVYHVVDTLVDEVSADHLINWDRVTDMLLNSDCLITHKHNSRKFLEANTPHPLKSRVRAMPCMSIDLDIDWKAQGVANNSLKYVSYVLGYFFDYHCLLSQTYAVLNVLQVAPGASDKLSASINHNYRFILATGPFSFQLRNELKDKGFQYSDGSKASGKGWWICVDEDKAAELLAWLHESKESVEGNNEVLSKIIHAKQRYSTQGEFKAAEMRMKATPKPKVSKKRNYEDANLGISP